MSLQILWCSKDLFVICSLIFVLIVPYHVLTVCYEKNGCTGVVQGFTWGLYACFADYPLWGCTGGCTHGVFFEQMTNVSAPGTHGLPKITNVSAPAPTAPDAIYKRFKISKECLSALYVESMGLYGGLYRTTLEQPSKVTTVSYFSLYGVVRGVVHSLKTKGCPSLYGRVFQTFACTGGCTRVVQVFWR